MGALSRPGPGVILTVTLNPAWDVTYVVPELRPGAAHRVQTASGRAGGKGVNVARVLHELGHATLVTGVLLGDVGAAVRHDLDRAGVPARFLDAGPRGQTRATVTIVD